MKIIRKVQEIWNRHKIEWEIPLPSSVTLTLSLHILEIGSAHRLTERNIWVKFNEHLFKGSADMERTRNRRLNPMNMKCGLDLASAI